MKRLLLFASLVACGGAKAKEPAPHRAPDPVPVAERTEPTPPVKVRPRAEEKVALLPQPIAGDPLKVTIHRLSNGMTVYLSPDAAEPSIVAHIAVRAGSRNDPELSTGLAHYLEHMLFKGTSQLGTLDYAKEKPHLDRIAQLYADLRKPGADRDKILKEIDGENLASSELSVPNELDKLYAQIGVTGLNAFTDSDATVYVSQIPKNRIAQWAKVEAARYSDAVFRLFWPELEAVYEEKNRGMDNPPRRVHDAFMKAMFPKHGYGWSSTIGEIEHLKSPAYQDMEAFFNRYYTPGNMAILLAGDVDESVLPVLEKAFGAFVRQPGEAIEDAPLPPPAKRSVLDVTVPSSEGIVLGWQLVPATHPDALAIEVMDLLLLGGTSGIITRDLLLPQKVADAGSNPTFMRESGFYEVTADALTGQTHDELEKLLLGVLDKVKKGDFTDADLAAAILSHEIAVQRQEESNNGRMGMMQEAFIDGEDWRQAATKLDRMHALKKEDILRVANRYLTPNYLVVRKVKGKFEPPKITKPGITPVKLDPKRQSPFAKAVLDMPVTPIEPVALVEGKDYVRGKLATGDALFVKNARNALFSLTAQYAYGRADDRLACLALEVMKVSGAGKRTPEQLARQLYELGLTVDTQCAKDEATITLAGIDRNLEAGMGLLREWLADPAFDDAILKATVTSALTERTNQVANPRAIASAAQQFAWYGADNEFLVTPSNKQLQAAKPAQVKAVLAKLLHLGHRTTYFGPRNGAEIAAAITLGDGKQAARAPHVERYRKPGGLFAVDQQTAQTQVWLVWPRPAASNDDRAAGTLFGEYAQPLLYQEVRESRGLAYTTFGGYSPGARKADAADAYAFAGTQGDKTHDALDAIDDTLKKPIDDVRFKEAQAGIAQKYRTQRIPPRAIPFSVWAWQDQGEKADPRAARTARIAKLDKAALEKWIKATLSAPRIVSIAGDRKKLDEAKLKKVAPVTWVPVDKLFGY